MPSPAQTSIVIVTWRGADHLGACLDAVAAQTRPHRLIVVDNASADGTENVLASHPSAPDVIRLTANLGYAGGIAAALPRVATPYQAWLNDDTVPAPGWLAALEDALDADDTVAAAASVLERPDGSVQSAGVGLTEHGYGVDLTTVPGDSDSEVFGFCGGAALVRTDALRAAGGVPAEFFCYYEDTDTSWRLRLAGGRIRCVPTARVRHDHGASAVIGSPAFHLWNERNRLLMLVRCAPAAVVLRELARFKVITLLLVLRRITRTLRTGDAGDAPNFRPGLRLRALFGVTRRLPAALLARRRVADRVTRRRVWRQARGGAGLPLPPS